MSVRVLDGRVFIDLDALLEIIHKVADNSTQLALLTNDTALASQTLGVINLAKTLEAMLEQYKIVHKIT